MPELPEVETIRRDLDGSVTGLKIKSLVFESDKEIKNKKDHFNDVLIGNKFKEIKRVGKLLIFELDNPYFLLIHLKMTGQLIFCSKNKFIAGGHSLEKGSLVEDVGGDLPNRYTRVIFNFINGDKLFFNDLRRFGYLKLVKKEELEEIISKYGIEPLKVDFTLENLKKVLKNRKASIKSILLNQNLISGIGNIYNDEILFKAGIEPERPANKIKTKEMGKIISSANKIIKKAIKNRGTTFSDYTDGQGRKGNFSNFLKVYGREGEKCKRCSGIIKKIKVANRGTYFCPKCQK